MGNAGSFNNITDQEIIYNLHQTGFGRRKGEEQLFAAYSYFIREGMKKYALSEDDAFDAYSDSILSAIQKISDGTFEGRSSVKTYIYQIFHNKCVDLLRKKTTHKSSVHQTTSISEMFFQISDSAKSVIQKLIEKNDWDLLKQRLNELGENCKQLLVFSASGNTDKEIAAIFGYKTSDVVKTSRLRCLEKLRQLYKL
ncbi:MAG: sigma-70 family RNA polymerase sigma factor [Bacteroidetes bacterium]|nr:sigma-70 family RNA polymerase sigma factor [Bacteroidota bacterium]